MKYKNYKKTIKDPDQERAMEELELFEEWKEKVLPELREMILSKKTAKEIAKTYSSHALARMVTIALTNKDAGKALAACKDIIDRADGKVEHKYQEMPDQQLDSLLRSELEDMDFFEMDNTKKEGKVQ